MSSHFATWPLRNWQSTMKTVDSAARSVRSFSPRSTTTLSESKSCDAWSQPVRLQTIIGRPVSSVGADQEPDLDAVDRDRTTGLAGARPVFAAGRRSELPLLSEDPAVAADDEEAVEQSSGHGFAFWMADEAGDAQVGTQTGESTHPAIRLFGNPVGSDQRLEPIPGHDELARERRLGSPDRRRLATISGRRHRGSPVQAVLGWRARRRGVRDRRRGRGG